MREIRTDRRGFLKGLLGISMAATVLPMLPAIDPVDGKPFVIQGETMADAPTTGTVLRSMGRLGRVRIEDVWLPLEDASISMFRRHAPLVYMPGSKVGSYQAVQSSPLIDS